MPLVRGARRFPGALRASQGGLTKIVLQPLSCDHSKGGGRALPEDDPGPPVSPLFVFSFVLPPLAHTQALVAFQMEAGLAQASWSTGAQAWEKGRPKLCL